MAEKILLIEDDFALAMGTEFALSAEGYKVVHADTIKKATECLDESLDLILLDIMLPDGNGYDFIGTVRAWNQNIPVIFLTAMGEEVNVVQGLELGADDYVTKPYRLKELMSRIAAHLRRSRINNAVNNNTASKHMLTENVHKFGAHIFDINALELRCNGHAVECSLSELKLLREFIVNKGQVLTRNQLLERLYDTGESFVDDNTLSVYIKRLRDKLDMDGEWIETVRGVGYRFRK